MLDGKIKQKIDEIIFSDIGIRPESIDPNQMIRDQVSLDSMQFIGLVAKLEIELEVELPVGIMQVKTLREFYWEIEKVLSGDIPA